MTSGQRVNDHWKRGTLLFKTLFDLSQYDFRFPRYRRTKKRVIFNCLLSPSLLFTGTSRSHLVSLTYPEFQTNTDEILSTHIIRVSRKIYRSVGRVPVHNLPAVLKLPWKTLSLYISTTD